MLATHGSHKLEPEQFEQATYFLYVSCAKDLVNVFVRIVRNQFAYAFSFIFLEVFLYYKYKQCEQLGGLNFKNGTQLPRNGRLVRQVHLLVHFGQISNTLIVNVNSRGSSWQLKGTR